VLLVCYLGITILVPAELTRNGVDGKIESGEIPMKLSVLFMLSAALSAVANAGILATELSTTVGQPAMRNTGNCDPFGCPQFFGLTTYQQIYASAAFSSPMAIDDITFFDSSVNNGGQPAGGLYTLSLSYSSRPLSGLDLTNPGNDISTGLDVFFSGTLPALSSGELSFSGSPFLYNPAAGNLLLTVTVSNPSDNSTPLYLDQSSSKSQTTNAYFGSYLGQPVSGGNNVGGLVTRFSYAAHGTTVPEPGSWLLLVSGLMAGVAVRVWRRGRRQGEMQ